MRVVREPGALAEALEGAAREAKSAFSDARVYIELTRAALGEVTPRRFRLGASGLIHDILATLDGAASSRRPTSSY
jgi:hypothetical protein